MFSVQHKSFQIKKLIICRAAVLPVPGVTAPGPFVVLNRLYNQIKVVVTELWSFISNYRLSPFGLGSVYDHKRPRLGWQRVKVFTFLWERKFRVKTWNMKFPQAWSSRAILAQAPEPVQTLEPVQALEPAQTLEPVQALELVQTPGPGFLGEKWVNVLEGSRFDLLASIFMFPSFDSYFEELL